MNLRVATFADEDLLLSWRNDPVVRVNSINTQIISRESHYDWLTKIINSHDTHLYIAEINGAPVGQGRIERAWKAISKDLDQALIGYSVEENYRGYGHGKELAKLLVHAAISLHGYTTVLCRIKRSNTKSLSVAVSAGVHVVEFF